MEDLANSRILIVDDQLPNLLLLEEGLKEEGFNFIYTTQDSRRVLQLYKEFKPDVVLLDLMMPDLNGFQVLEQLETFEQESFSPVIVLTATDDKEAKLRALKLGAKDLICKPFDFTEVIYRVLNLLKMRKSYLKLKQKIEDSSGDPREKNSAHEDLTVPLHNALLGKIHQLTRAQKIDGINSGSNHIPVSQYAYILGEALGFPEEQCLMLRQASSLYDIGKIGIPKTILQKPGKLTPEEWEVMKTHTTLGAELLSGSDTPLMNLARTIALQHHEKWDGSGYPNGLSSDQISLEARIVSICDVFDGMTAHRPYAKLYSINETMAYIEQNAGRHFDPGLVLIFRKLLPKILDMKEEFKEITEPIDVSSINPSDLKLQEGIRNLLPEIIEGRQQKKVLVVDDSDLMRHIMIRILKQIDFEIENISEASNGLIARNIIKKEPIDLVVSDQKMPTWTGLELLKYIRSESDQKGLPFLMVSEDGSKETVLQAIGLGVDQYLLKPFNSFQLEEKIYQVFKTKLLN